MNVTFRMIDRDLRAAGLAFKVLNNTFTPARLRLLGRLMKRIRIPVRGRGIDARERWITRPDGTQFRAVVFRPCGTRPDAPGVLWLHGGGYAIGAPEQCRVAAQRLFEASPCVVVAPEYRLSVEAPYPAALEDAYAALLWMRDHAAELGVRSNQLMVGGESAGGGLTAALTLYARDRGEVSIAFQMPLYPMLDDRMTSESARDNNAPVWNSRSNRNAWKLYLGELYGSGRVPAYAAPGRTREYAGLPPAVTFVGELEPFRDETITYVENLRKAGVDVRFEVYPGCYHGFDVVCPKARVSQRAVSFLQSSYRHAASSSFAEQPSR